MSFDPETVRAFDMLAGSGLRALRGYVAPATAPYIARLLDVAGIARGGRVLDVACGRVNFAGAAVRAAQACSDWISRPPWSASQAVPILT